MATLAHGSRIRFWPWLVLGLATLPAIWYVVDFESDIDPEFPGVVRPTFNTYPPPAYRFAEPGDTIDHVAIYVAAAAIVLSGWGLLRGSRKRLWTAALALSLAGYWHAATPGPLMDGWYGLGWRTIWNTAAPWTTRLSLVVAAASLLGLVLWGLTACPIATLWKNAREHAVAWLIIVAGALILVRQVRWIDREPIGFWPRWIYVWGLLAWSLALVQIVPRATASARWTRGAIVASLVLLWLGIDFTGRGLLWHQRPLHRLREVVADRIYLSAMPTYQGLELAQERHHFRTIINLFPERTPERSPLLPDELRFAREHGLNYVGNDQDDDRSGEAFVARTLALAQEASAWPILVHCHASMDRSPAWMGLYRFVVQGWPLADALREIECHRGLRPKASVTLLYNRVLPRLAPDRSAHDPTVPILRQCAVGTVDPLEKAAANPAARSRQDSQALKPSATERR